MPLNQQLAQGIDISVHNGMFDPFKATERIDFVIARATIGINKDTRFSYNSYAVKPMNVPFMAYHYFWAAVPWKTQADNFLATIEGSGAKMLWWDYEGKSNILNANTAKDSVTAMSYLRQASGLPVGLYADRQRTSDIYTQAPASMDFPLWVAQYYTNQTLWNNTPNVEPMYKPQFERQMPYLFWQFASELNWLGHDAGHNYGLESHSVDINVCKKTPAELNAYLGLWSNETPPAPTTIETRLTAIEKEARNHGWNIA